MSADYSKAGDHEERLHAAREAMCKHERTDSTSNGTYCLDCGLRMITEPAPVKLDYATAVGDAKTLNWRRIPYRDGPLPMPVDKAFYVAWEEMPWGSSSRRWRVERVEAGAKLPALALWWADDLLGLPPCND